MQERSQPRLLPLGSLGPPADGTPWSGEALELDPNMPHEQRTAVAEYMEGCPIFLAWMEYTRDVVGDRFGVSGGSAISSDGVYYWRVDGVEYVKEYGVVIPPLALAHFVAAEWRPPVLPRSRFIEIYSQLKHMFGEEVVG